MEFGGELFARAEGGAYCISPAARSAHTEGQEAVAADCGGVGPAAAALKTPEDPLQLSIKA